MVILLNSDINITINAKIDTFALIFGNFLIAYFIAAAITKKHKDTELKITNCFKELDYLLNLVYALRTEIKANNDTLEDFIVRFDSLSSLQIELIKKYSFINSNSKRKLSDEHYKLSKSLTDDSTINDDYKIYLLRIEEIVLNIKSNIL